MIDLYDDLSVNYDKQESSSSQRFISVEDHSSQVPLEGAHCEYIVIQANELSGYIMIHTWLVVFNFNHIVYADDMVLLSPSIQGLQCLLNVCDMYAKEQHDIINIIWRKDN